MEMNIGTLSKQVTVFGVAFVRVGDDANVEKCVGY